MPNVPLNHNIDTATREKFYAMCAYLPGTYGEKLGAMIEAFAALPVSLQDRLCSKLPGAADEAKKKLSAIGTLEAGADAVAQDAKKQRSHTRRKTRRPGS